jgi:hypothetical protein
MQTLTNYIQSWLSESENPLVELYRYLRMLFIIPSFISLRYILNRLLLSIPTFTDFI